MSTTARPFTLLLIISALLAIAACGSSRTKACNGDCCAAIDACPSMNFLVANTLSGQIASYPVIAGSVIGTPTLTPNAPASLGMVFMNNQFLYASNPTSLSGGEINAWAFSLGTGTLTTVQGSPFLLGVTSVAGGLAVTDPGISVLYVADAGKIDALQASATGVLTPLPNSPFASGTNLYLTVDPTSHFLFASDDDPPGGVLAFTIDSTGALTPVPGSPFAATTNLGGNAQPAEIVVDSSGSYVYTALNATGQVAGFAINTTTGTLTPIPGSPFAAGNGPLALVAPGLSGNYLYVSNATDRTVSAYSINSANGVLTPVAGSPYNIAAGAFASNGSTFFASTAAGIRVFTINPETGVLTEVNGSPYPGSGATVLALVP